MASSICASLFGPDDILKDRHNEIQHVLPLLLFYDPGVANAFCHASKNQLCRNRTLNITLPVLASIIAGTIVIGILV